MVGKRSRGRQVGQQAARPIEATIDEPEGDDLLDQPASELRLGIAVLDWWEIERWHDVTDDAWGDPSAEAVRTARNLRRGKRMDT